MAVTVRATLRIRGARVSACVQCVDFRRRFGTTPIDAFNEHVNTCSTFAKSASAAYALVTEQGRGRHIRARTVENMRQRLSDSAEAVSAVLEQAEYRTGCVESTLERNAGATCHFLCMLRHRICPDVPAEVWREHIVPAVLPAVSTFGYSQGGMRVELAPLTPLPPLDAITRGAPLLVGAASTSPHGSEERRLAPLLDGVDALRVHGIGTAWTASAAATGARLPVDVS